MDRAVQKIAAVKLPPRFLGPDFQHPARGWFGHARVQTQFAHRMVDDPVIAKLDLLVIGVDTRTDRSRVAEVKRRARHRVQFTGREQGKPNAVRVPSSCSSLEAIEKILHRNKAVLDVVKLEGVRLAGFPQPFKISKPTKKAARQEGRTRLVCACAVVNRAQASTAAKARMEF